MPCRVMYAVLGVVLALFTVPAAGHAQLGGLVKKKAVEKATGKQDTVAVAGKPAKEKCDPSSMVITSDVVDRYLKSLGASEAAQQKLAKEPGKTGAYYSALFKQRAAVKRKAEFDRRRGPDWEKFQALEKRMLSGDTAAIMPYSTFAQSLDPNQVQVPQLEWEDPAEEQRPDRQHDEGGRRVQ